MNNELTEKEVNEICDQIFKDTGKTEFVRVAESSANKAIKEGTDHMNSVIDRIKDLPNWQVDNFLVALAIKSQEYSDFKAHPNPSATARGFICKYFEGGKP